MIKNLRALPEQNKGEAEQGKARFSRNGRRGHSFARDISAWLLMLPALILFAYFVFAPLIKSVVLSVQAQERVEVINEQGKAEKKNITVFAGLDNYKSIFADPEFAIAWKNTFMYVLFSLILGFLVPIFMAAMITESPFLRGLTRVAVYLPNILPGLAVVLIWKFFFNAGDTGVLNILIKPIGQLIEKLGGPVYKPFNWLSAPGWGIPLIVLTLTWKAAGSTALIYMAGISGINPDIIEAATIDGAKPLRRFFSVTLPNLGPLISTMFILQIISVFQILYEPMMIGGITEKQISVMMLVYKYAFQSGTFSFGKASAMSVLICLALVFLTVIYFAVNRAVNGGGFKRRAKT
jgi:multiple sugar transport system permease protein